MIRRLSTVIWVACGISLVGILLAGDLAYRHYRSSLATFARSPGSPILATPDAVGVPGLQSISFRSGDGVPISAWYSPSKNGAAIVLAHGTGADRTSLIPELRFLAGQGFGVIAYDGPGYGLSGGKARWGADAEFALVAAVSWLVDASATNPVRIGGLGLSMGGYALLQAANADPRIEALVLEAVPPDVVETTRWQHRKWLAVSQWPALWALQSSPELLTRPTAEDRISRIAPRPILLVSGDQDQVVPLFMTERMFRKAGDSKELLVIPGAVHGRYAETSPQEYPARVIDFFRRKLLPRNPIATAEHPK